MRGQWEKWGDPRDRHGITVAGADQRVWLDTPSGPGRLVG